MFHQDSSLNIPVSKPSLILAATSTAGASFSAIDCEIAYTPSGYVTTTSSPDPRVADPHAPWLKSTQWCVGKWRVDSFANVNHISARSGPDAVKTDPWGPPPSLGPLVCEGRGLSELSDIDVLVGTTATTLTGRHNGQLVRALLDPRNQYIATQIETFAPSGTEMSRYLISSPTRDPDGFVYGAHCEATGAEGAILMTFDIASLTTRAPALNSPDWLDPAQQVLDTRVPGGTCTPTRDF